MSEVAVPKSLQAHRCAHKCAEADTSFEFFAKLCECIGIFVAHACPCAHIRAEPDTSFEFFAKLCERIGILLPMLVQICVCCRPFLKLCIMTSKKGSTGWDSLQTFSALDNGRLSTGTANTHNLNQYSVLCCYVGAAGLHGVIGCWLLECHQGLWLHLYCRLLASLLDGFGGFWHAHSG